MQKQECLNLKQKRRKKSLTEVILKVRGMVIGKSYLSIAWVDVYQ